MPRFFKSLPQPPAVGEQVALDGQDAVHIRRALRMQCGEALLLCDGRSTEYDTVIDGFDGDRVYLRVRAIRPSTAEPSLRLTLYQGLPKGDKMDWIVQKAVELGAAEIVPVLMSRSIAKLGDKADKKCARWQTIANEAAGQSGRGILPRVCAPLTVEALLSRVREELTIVCYEGGGQPLPSLIAADQTQLSLVIGPEGGIAPDEVARLQEAGASLATLGPRILRCETAPLAAIAAIMALTGNFD